MFDKLERCLHYSSDPTGKSCVRKLSSAPTASPTASPTPPTTNPTSASPNSGVLSDIPAGNSNTGVVVVRPYNDAVPTRVKVGQL